MYLYHLGFSESDLSEQRPSLAFLSGDPERARHIAMTRLEGARVLSDHRGLTSVEATLHGRPVLSCTSGMGAPSASIVFNELAQLGIRTVIRIGTCGSIQDHVLPGDVVISSASLCRHGAADDIAPREFPAAADPFLTVVLSESATALSIRHAVGVTASVDTFFEGQERAATSANPQLLRRHVGATEEYRNLGVLNYEMESGTLFKAGLVYGVSVGCVCAVVAQRTVGEDVRLDVKGDTIERAIDVAVEAARRWLAR